MNKQISKGLLSQRDLKAMRTSVIVDTQKDKQKEEEQFLLECNI